MAAQRTHTVLIFYKCLFREVGAVGVGASLCVFERTHSVVTFLGWFGLTAGIHQSCMAGGLAKY